MSELGLRGISALGFLVLLGTAWLVSSDRRAIDKKLVAWGVALQILLSVGLLATPFGKLFFSFVEIPVAVLIEATGAGVDFVFGPLATIGHTFALGVLPVIIVMGSLFSIFYYLGWVQPIVHGLARILAEGLHQGNDL